MSTALPDSTRSVQWTGSKPMEAHLKVSTSAPLPSEASSLPEDATLVKIAYSTLNPVDYKMPEAPGAKFMLSKPHIPCSDFAGIVVATTMAHVKVGDKVAGSFMVPKFGALAEYAVVKGATNLALLPQGVELADAATLGIAAQTAYQSIKPFVKAGSKVVINGASGGVGIFGIQIAKILDCHVVAICSGANVDLCKSLGADEVIDYKTTDVVQALKDTKTQYDLLLNYVDVAGPFYMQSHHYLKPGGRYLTIAGGLDMASVIGMARMLLPTFLGGGKSPAKFVMVKVCAEDLTTIAEWVKDGKMKTCIEKVYQLDEVADAFRRSKSGRARGKLVVSLQ